MCSLKGLSVSIHLCVFSCDPLSVFPSVKMFVSPSVHLFQQRQPSSGIILDYCSLLGHVITRGFARMVCLHFVRPIKMPNFTFGKFTFAQSEFAKHFLGYFKFFLKNLFIFYTCKCTFSGR
jgi:hypothetical protein